MAVSIFNYGQNERNIPSPLFQLFNFGVFVYLCLNRVSKLMLVLMVYLAFMVSVSANALIDNPHQETQKTKPIQTQHTTPSERISLNFKQAPISMVLDALASQKQLNLVVNDDLEQVITLKLHDVSWQDAIKAISKVGKLKITEDTGLLLAESLVSQTSRNESSSMPSDFDDLDSLEDHENAGFNASFETLHYAFSEADVNDVSESLLAQRSGLLSPQGSVTVDKRNNALLVRDKPEILKQLNNWLEQMDTPLKQVQIAAHIVTISSEELRALGVQWGLMGENSSAKAGRLNNLGVTLPVSNQAANIGFNVARINSRLLDLELTALEQESQVEIIASPRLMTTHQQTASIKQGTEIPYEVASGNNGGTSIEFREAVLGMEVTPKILNNGQITLSLNIMQNSPGKTVKQTEGEALTIDKQEIQTQVTVKDGETIVLGGIFQQQKSLSKDKVPGLGDVPVLGGLFSRTDRLNSKRELVIFITPTLY